MAKYLYNALKNNKTIISGELEASSLREAREKIRTLGLIPTKVCLQQATNIDKSDTNNFTEQTTGRCYVSRLSLQEKMMFTSELQVLLSSGIPIIDALQLMKNKGTKLKIKQICSDLGTSIMNGMSFSEALKSKYFKVFGSLYIGLCISGEASGELDLTLERMLVLLRKQDTIKGKIIISSIYPAILIFMMIILLFAFSKLILPKFIIVMSASIGDIPPFIAMYICIINFITDYLWLYLLFNIVAIYVLILLFKTKSFKKKLDNFILKVPFVCDFIRYINLSNFMTVLQISYDAGIPIMSGLELAQEAVGNLTIKKQVEKSLDYVKTGKDLSASFEQSKLMSGPILFMVSAGEKSGNLGKMMHDSVDLIDKKVDMTLEVMTRMFEPTVIVIVGIGVCILVLVLYKIYFGMLGSFF